MIECGVYEGFLSSFLNFGMRRAGIAFHQYAADTFEGFPKTYTDQKTYKAGDLAPTYGDFVVRELQRLGITVLKGPIEKTLSVIPDSEKFFFVFLDLDVYEPTKATWEILRDRVLPGGRVGLHDFGSPGLPGITKVGKEMLAQPDWHEVFRGKKRDNRFLFLEKE